MERALIASSDGHAMANMPDYKPYLPSKYQDEFSDFCEMYAKVGFRNTDPKSLGRRLDEGELNTFVREMHDSNKIDGTSDPYRRLEIMEAEGVVAEVLFPDFGLPFELFGPIQNAFSLETPPGAERWCPRTREHLVEGFRAHNRWLVDFCSVDPSRFVATAVTLFDDVDAAIKEIKWAKSAGFRGVLLPEFDEQAPLFHERYDPIWSTLEELDMPANIHVISSSTTPVLPYSGIPHPALSIPINHAVRVFRLHEILNHLIWGAVLERHPRLKVCFTESGSGWVIGALKEMDYSYDGSYLRSDVRDVLKRRPSQYFADQIYLGSSIFSRAEVGARNEIGVNNMCLGMDYPHHEGTVKDGTLSYLRATVGASHVPKDEARKILGENLIALWGLDKERLSGIAAKVGPSLDEILTPPTEDLFPLGDVHKPLSSSAL